MTRGAFVSRRTESIGSGADKGAASFVLVMPPSASRRSLKARAALVPSSDR